MLSYDFFNTISKQYESFQLFSEGPLIFDIKDSVYFVATEKSVHEYFGEKGKIFKLSIVPKFRKNDDCFANIDIRSLSETETEVSVRAIVESVQQKEEEDRAVIIFSNIF